MNASTVENTTAAQVAHIGFSSAEELEAYILQRSLDKGFQKKQAQEKKSKAQEKKAKKADFLKEKMDEFGITQTVAHSLQVADRPAAQVVIASFKVQGISGTLQISVATGKLTAKQTQAKVEEAINLTLGMLEATASIFAGEEGDEETEA
jgi:hypothetical protein